MPSRQVLSALAGAIATAEAAFGPAWSTGPVASGSNIIESSATLTLPALSSTNKGDLSLWVGMGTSKGDLIQSIAETYQDGAWAVYAYTLLETSRKLKQVPTNLLHCCSNAANAFLPLQRTRRSPSSRLRRLPLLVTRLLCIVRMKTYPNSEPNCRTLCERA